MEYSPAENGKVLSNIEGFLIANTDAQGSSNSDLEGFTTSSDPPSPNQARPSSLPFLQIVPPEDDSDSSMSKEEEKTPERTKTEGYESANLLSKLLWCWIDPLFYKGFRQKELDHEDLYPTANAFESEKLVKKFNENWDIELERKRSGRKPRLFVAVIKMIWPKLLIHIILAAGKLSLSILLAIFVGKVSDFFASSMGEDELRDALLYALGISLAFFLSAFIHNHGFLQAQEVGMLSRIICSGAIFEKVLQLDQQTISQVTIGKVINLASNDVRRLDFAFLYGPYCVLAPLHLLTVIILLWVYVGGTGLGPSCLAGMAMFIFWVPFQIAVSKLYSKLRIKAAKYTDNRVRLMNDIITGIKVVKMYAWENAFKKLVAGIRRKETRLTQLAALFRASNDGFYLISISLFSFLTFTTFTYATGQPLSPGLVFTSIAMLRTLRTTTVIYLVEGILGIQEARIGFNRIQELLELGTEAPLVKEELSKSTITNGHNKQPAVLSKEETDSHQTAATSILQNNIIKNESKNGEVAKPAPLVSQKSVTFNSQDTVVFEEQGSEVGVSVSNVSASWNPKGSLTIEGINFEAKKGEVTTIIGPVGSGKSTLLQAILGEMKITENGRVRINGAVAYASQEPWVFAGTLRDNILFGQPYEEVWYWEVVEACCLREDINQFPYRDYTPVGERGVALSGGQRARVNLARAIYARADVYLLDDPLSALDPDTEHHLFNNCIRTLLENSTVILATHQIPIVQLSDHVVVIRNGKLLTSGKFFEIMNLATSNDEDNPVVKGLREALDALIAEDEEITETLDEVFSEPSTPVVNKLVRLASKLSMNKHPKPLLRAQTDLGFRLMRQNTFQMEKPVTPTSGLPLSAELQRKKITPERPSTLFGRRSTVAESANLERHSLKHIAKTGPLAILAASKLRLAVDEDLDFSPFTQSFGHRYEAPRTHPLVRQQSNLSAIFSPTPSGPGTPSTPLKRKKSFITRLADRIEEADEEDFFDEEEEESEEEVEETDGGAKTPIPSLPASPGPQKIDPEEVPDAPLEDKGHGRITVKTYYQYLKMGSGRVLFVFLILLFLFSQAGLIITDSWLSYWADRSASCENETVSAAWEPLCQFTDNHWIGVYGGLVLITMLMAFCRALLFFYVAIRSAKKLHNQMFGAILRVPMRFFDINPIGRILNRFAKDVGFLDDVLPTTFYDFMTIMLEFVSVLLIAVAASYIVIVPTIIVMILFLFMRAYYIKTARDIKRLEAIARSPLYSHISTTFQGLATIRALKCQKMTLEWYHVFQNENTKGWSAYITSTRWFGLRMDLISAIFVTVLVFISIPLVRGASYLVNPSLIGLAMALAVGLAGVFQYGVRLSTEVESLMVSAERLMSYGRLPPEAPLQSIFPSKQPPKSWPHKGDMVLKNMRFRYSYDTPLVIKELSCNIQGSEKIGVVGRSGAGKSSILNALYRISEPQGQILIDGISITDIGLHELRSKMSIIPQDPVLFSSSVRFNLDPLNDHTDVELWNILERVQLKSTISEMQGLQGEVAEGGSNFSIGQRQLFCLARAMLRKSRILVIDEATANVDMNTDAIIQQAIRKEFKHCTVITIAHRLHTIMDSDRILVLNTGRLKEFDSPHTLLQNQHSTFSLMVSQCGPEESKKLKQVALEAFKKKESLKRKREGRKRRRSQNSFSSISSQASLSSVTTDKV